LEEDILTVPEELRGPCGVVLAYTPTIAVILHRVAEASGQHYLGHPILIIPGYRRPRPCRRPLAGLVAVGIERVRRRPGGVRLGHQLIARIEGGGGPRRPLLLERAIARRIVDIGHIVAVGPRTLLPLQLIGVVVSPRHPRAVRLHHPRP